MLPSCYSLAFVCTCEEEDGGGSAPHQTSGFCRRRAPHYCIGRDGRGKRLQQVDLLIAYRMYLCRMYAHGSPRSARVDWHVRACAPP